jgi:hypothetical protein
LRESQLHFASGNSDAIATISSDSSLLTVKGAQWDKAIWTWKLDPAVASARHGAEETHKEAKLYGTYETSEAAAEALWISLVANKYYPGQSAIHEPGSFSEVEYYKNPYKSPRWQDQIVITCSNRTVIFTQKGYTG